jgi:phosphoserine phosphatase RsbU/P
MCVRITVIVLRRTTKEVLALHESGLPIGIGEDYEEHMVQLNPGDRIYLYSDGVTEMKNAEKRLYGMDNLVPLCTSKRIPEPHRQRSSPS